MQPGLNSEAVGLQFPEVSPTADSSTMMAHIRSSIERGLPSAAAFAPHDRTLCVVGGGPSIVDTVDDLEGDIAAVNGSLDFLMDKGIKPWACGVVDPGEHMAKVVTPYDDVFYFVASMVHPGVFHRLAFKKVILWHAGVPEDAPHHAEMNALLDGEMLVGGGTTMGLRWINLGYVMGYRKFHLHGLDSSYRDNRTHAYPDYANKAHILVDGYVTSLNFYQQVKDFFELMDLFDDIEVTLHGEGLLQSRAHA